MGEITALFGELMGQQQQQQQQLYGFQQNIANPYYVTAAGSLNYIGGYTPNGLAVERKSEAVQAIFAPALGEHQQWLDRRVNEMLVAL